MNSGNNYPLGIVLVLCSALTLSLQNVVISIVLNKSSVFGIWNVGGYISPNFGNSLLILLLRMTIAIPLMSAIVLYSRRWSDIRRFLKSGDGWGFLQVIACGFFLFAASALIYMALGELTPGVALTLFFVFPIVTVLMSWLLFGERPSLIRSLVTQTVYLGVVLIAVPAPNADIRLSTLGIVYALAAGIMFAFHLLLIQACTKKLHPVPFSLLNFVGIFAFSLLSLSIALPEPMQINIAPDMWNNVLMSSLLLGCLTLLSYLTNYMGIRRIGAARASIFGASGPALTALLAWFSLGRSLSVPQLWGILLVGVAIGVQTCELLFSPKLKAMDEHNDGKG
ncbi:MAG: DMT family transporter [Spirulina sp.]